ncbi:MAG: thioredoxin domain-containing protein [Myxococcales bacterium]|nr:thioredoxin domain-containing protein [Myxococcales bacterium]
MKRRLGLLFCLVGCTARYQPVRCPTATTAAAPGSAETARVAPLHRTGDDPIEGAPLEDSPRVPVAGAPMLGPAQARVTVVVFSDFQCPYCARGRSVATDLRAMFPSDVRVVWRHFPLARHPQAHLAAEAASEVFAQRGHAAFWQFHDLLFAHQDSLSRELIERLAVRVGALPEGITRALDEGTHRDAVDRDIALGQQLGVTGTPAFVVNGTTVVGARAFADFEQLTLNALDRAAHVTDPSRVYAAAVADPLPAPERPDPERAAWLRTHTLAAPARAPVWGEANAPVTMEVFSDFQCGFCRRLEPTLASLRTLYPGRLRIVWRDYPLPNHGFAMLAAEAAREAQAQRGDEGFWRFHDMIFEHQQEEGGLDRPALERYARAMGLDLVRFRRALDAHTHRELIEADMRALSATGLRVGTPTVFLNGHLIAGARPLDEFRARIDSLLTI